MSAVQYYTLGAAYLTVTNSANVVKFFAKSAVRAHESSCCRQLVRVPKPSSCASGLTSASYCTSLSKAPCRGPSEPKERPAFL